MGVIASAGTSIGDAMARRVLLLQMNIATAIIASTTPMQASAIMRGISALTNASSSSFCPSASTEEIDA